ncbi:hypothetical protein niasHS_009740 [Heterodera schachtii]|uniref:DNA-directed DNA polymerase n=1 Tax=Heterodera schachtii TaxID=97005 RepID=A0ABD2IYS2_HETSC
MSSDDEIPPVQDGPFTPVRDSNEPFEDVPSLVEVINKLPEQLIFDDFEAKKEPKIKGQLDPEQFRGEHHIFLDAAHAESGRFRAYRFLGRFVLDYIWNSDYPENVLKSIFMMCLNYAMNGAEAMNIAANHFIFLLTARHLDYEIAVHFKNVKKIEDSMAETILARFEIVDQSNKSKERPSICEESFVIDITAIESGLERKKLAGKGSNNSFEIPYNISDGATYNLANNDNFCLFRAFEWLRMKHVLQHQRFSEYKRNERRQLSDITTLCRACGINMSLPFFSIEEYGERIQAYYDRHRPGMYRLFCFGTVGKMKPLWKSEDIVYKQELCVLFTEGDAGQAGHYTTQSNQQADYLTFESRECFEHHAKVIKATIKKGDKELQDQERGHVCGHEFCRVCLGFHAPRECYIPYRPKKKTEKRIIFFDFECTTDFQPDPEIARFKHQVNFCYAHVTCTSCIEKGSWNQALEQKCGICGDYRTYAWVSFDFYNTEAVNYGNVLDTLPPLEDYSPGSHFPEERMKLEKWHADNINTRFDLREIIADYCKTALSHQDNERIAIVSHLGYEKRGKQSTIARKYLKWRAEEEMRDNGWTLHFIESPGGEYKYGNYSLDGMMERPGMAKNLAIEVTGNLIDLKKSINEAIVSGGETAGAIRARDAKRVKQIARDFEVEIIWECHLMRMLEEDPAMKAFFDNTPDSGPIEFRDVFFGGRTGPDCLAMGIMKPNGEKLNRSIKIKDFNSLYPSRNMFTKYPIGHPTLLKMDKDVEWTKPVHMVDNDGVPIEGIIKCFVVPPRHCLLDIPVIPVRMNNRTLFMLCRRCSEMYPKGLVDPDYNCPHFEDHERASGYPAKCLEDGISEEEREERQQQHIDNCYAKSKVRLEAARIKPNPGLRYIAKLCLNSLWGRFALRNRLTKTEIVDNDADLGKLLNDDKIELSSLDQLTVDCHRTMDNICGTARLHLLESMQQVYCTEDRCNVTTRGLPTRTRTAYSMHTVTTCQIHCPVVHSLEEPTSKDQKATHLRYALKDVPPQSNSPPDTVIGAGRRATGWPDLTPKWTPLRAHSRLPINAPQAALTTSPRTIPEGTARSHGQKPPVSRNSPADPTFRANSFPEVTNLICRLPLPTLFYRLEAVHLGDLLRISGRVERTRHHRNRGALRAQHPYLRLSHFQARTP